MREGDDPQSLSLLHRLVTASPPWFRRGCGAHGINAATVGNALLTLLESGRPTIETSTTMSIDTARMFLPKATVKRLHIEAHSNFEGSGDDQNSETPTRSNTRSTSSSSLLSDPLRHAKSYRNAISLSTRPKDRLSRPSSCNVKHMPPPDLQPYQMTQSIITDTACAPKHRATHTSTSHAPPMSSRTPGGA